MPVRNEGPSLPLSVRNIVMRLAELDQRIATKIFIGVNNVPTQNGNGQDLDVTAVKEVAAAFKVCPDLEIIEIPGMNPIRPGPGYL